MLIIHRQGVGIRSEMGELRSSCSVGTSGICQHVLYGCQCADIGFFVFYGVHKKQRVEEAHCVRLDAISFWHPSIELFCEAGYHCLLAASRLRCVIPLMLMVANLGWLPSPTLLFPLMFISLAAISSSFLRPGTWGWAWRPCLQTTRCWMSSGRSSTTFGTFSWRSNEPVQKSMCLTGSVM